MAAPGGNAFPPQTLAFLRELAGNNRRDWFKPNKARYEEQVLDPALNFIVAMQAPLADFAPHFTAVPDRVGGSLMRIYRDTRFSKDKQPYKTNVGIQFRHESARDVHAPGYYVHVAPGDVFVGAGMWRPDPDSLRAIRQRIAARPAEWGRVVGDATFRRHFRLGGDSLTRAPRGFDKDHECIDDIRRTSFIAVREFDEGACLKPGFRRSVETAFRAADGYMRFLCDAVRVPF